MDNVSQMSAQRLAFLGDAVYELFIRERIVNEEKGPIGELNKLKVGKVCCETQSEMFKKIEGILTEEEFAICRRGRNVRTGRVPKNSSGSVYHQATGLEALFGYLYLKRRILRIEELLKIMNI